MAVPIEAPNKTTHSTEGISLLVVFWEEIISPEVIEIFEYCVSWEIPNIYTEKKIFLLKINDYIIIIILLTFTTYHTKFTPRMGGSG